MMMGILMETWIELAPSLSLEYHQPNSEISRNCLFVILKLINVLWYHHNNLVTSNVFFLFPFF